MHIPFIHPCTIIIAGPSRSGKTVFVRRLIIENMLEPAPSRIVFVYGDWQPEYEKILEARPNAEFCKGPLTGEMYENFNPKERNLLVIDDQMVDASKSTLLEKFFVQGSHHRNLTVVFIVQNLFEKGKSMRTTNLNSNYLVLYKNPRDKGQAGILGRQMYPTKWREFISAFQQATEEPYSYLVIDLMPNTPEEYRLRGRIFPFDSSMATDVYVI